MATMREKIQKNLLQRYYQRGREANRDHWLGRAFFRPILADPDGSAIFRLPLRY